MTALLGRNGVGKTTTLRALLGLVPAEGQRRRSAAPTSIGEPTHRIVRRGVGYVPEDRDVFSTLTVAENLELAVRNGSARYDLRLRALPGAARRAPRSAAGTLSGGQQQMLAIARALLNENRILLVDEPTKGLAPLLVAEVAAALERVCEESTVLLVEQNLERRPPRRRARRRARHGPRRPHRPGAGAARRPRARPLAAGGRHEHGRPAHDHGPRARGDVLPRRVRAVADLRADGRAQLRARRRSSPSARTRPWFIGVEARRRSRSRRASCSARSSGSRSGRCSRRSSSSC